MNTRSYKKNQKPATLVQLVAGFFIVLLGVVSWGMVDTSAAQAQTAPPPWVEREWPATPEQIASIEYMNVQYAQIQRERESLDAREKALRERFDGIMLSIRKSLGVKDDTKVNFDAQRLAFQQIAPTHTTVNAVAPVGSR